MPNKQNRKRLESTKRILSKHANEALLTILMTAGGVAAGIEILEHSPAVMSDQSLNLTGND